MSSLLSVCEKYAKFDLGPFSRIEILTTASQKDLDDNDVPFLNRDKCAAHLITYYKCLNKGTSFCSASKDQFYECQYIALKERLGKH